MRAGRTIAGVAKLSRWALVLTVLVTSIGLLAALAAGQARAGKNAGASGNPYGAWQHGPSSDPSFFPIAVWLQQPANAPRYQALGFNMYVGLWKGPTEEQLAALHKVNMPVICAQNDVGLRHRDDPIIVGWMHGDEPDNAQPTGGGKYGPPIPPEKIIADYQRMHQYDPSRPVMLNLGQGVAWDGWVGRGVRMGHPEDYPEYVKGCDIASFDIYPVVHSKPQVAGKLWFVPFGVDRLRKWTEDRKVVWNCIECTRIANPKVKPTPAQVRAEVWMSLIHGSMGLIYFVHQFKPQFIEAGLLADPEMSQAVGKINAQIRELAPVLNSPSLPSAAAVTTGSPLAPVDIMVKGYHGFLYLFAVAMRDMPAHAVFFVPDASEGAKVEVLGEERTLTVTKGRFADDFAGYAVHLYRLALRK